jgi:hypothetical protein
MGYTVSTIEKKSVEEHLLWQKGDYVIRIITGFRWGTYYVNSVDEPKLNIDHQFNGVNMNDVDDSEMEYLDDGWMQQIEFPDDMDDAEKERLEILWDDESFEGFEKEGWVNYDTEVWFFGPLEILKDDDDI